jgi:hypothetical protein
MTQVLSERYACWSVVIVECQKNDRETVKAVPRVLREPAIGAGSTNR